MRGEGYLRAFTLVYLYPHLVWPQVVWDVANINLVRAVWNVRRHDTFYLGETWQCNAGGSAHVCCLESTQAAPKQGPTSMWTTDGNKPNKAQPACGLHMGISQTRPNQHVDYRRE